MNPSIKTLFLFLVGIASGFAVFAQPGYDGMLKVRLTDNYPITIAVDGRYFHKHGPLLTVGHLPRGRHFVKVYSYTPGNENTRARLLFEDRVRIRPDMIAFLVIDPTTGQSELSLEPMTGNLHNESGSGVSHYDTPPPPMPITPGNMEESENNADGHSPDSRNNGYTNQMNNHLEPDQSERPDAKESVNAAKTEFPMIKKADLSKLSTKVGDLITDTDKLNAIMNGLKKKSVNTEQLSTIMSWLSFESSKVELLRWAYTHTTDRQNYRLLETEFSYPATKEEIEKFINSRK